MIYRNIRPFYVSDIRPGFTAIPHALIDDSGLSPGAKGLMCWVYAMQEGTLTFSLADAIASSRVDPQDVIASLLAELVAAGYLAKEHA